MLEIKLSHYPPFPYPACPLHRVHPCNAPLCPSLLSSPPYHSKPDAFSLLHPTLQSSTTTNHLLRFSLLAFALSDQTPTAYLPEQDTSTLQHQAAKMATPDEAIVHAIRGILGQVNLDTFTLKEVRERLENQFGEDVVEDRSDFIHSTVESVVADLIAGEDEGMDDGREDVGNAYTRPLALSPDLASFLGTDRAKRSDVVKHIWRYIREQGLMKQGPNYILDARLQALFNRKTISFTTMMKALSPHMKDPTQLVGHDEAGQFVGKNPAMDDKRVIRNEAGEIQMVRRRRSGLTRPYHLTPELANVVGKDVMGRTGVSVQCCCLVPQ